jgi:hypothetical protein
MTTTTIIIVTSTTDMNITVHISVRQAKQRKVIAETSNILSHKHNLSDGPFGGHFLFTE